MNLYKKFIQTKTFPSLDGMRAIAILAVIWHHIKTPADVPHMFSYGFRGVNLFFALSGFLISTRLLREYRVYGKVDLPRFFMRRILRIFPVYYLILLVYCLVVRFMERDAVAAALFWHNLPFFLSYTANFFVPLDPKGGRVIFYFVWSLAAEEQFYVAWPLVFRTIRRYAPHFLICLLVFREAFMLGMDPANPLYIIVQSISTGIAAGVLLAHMLDSERWFNVFYRIFGHRLVPVIALALSLVLHDYFLKFSFQFLATVFIGSCVVRPDNFMAPVLNWGPLTRVGKVSYGMYLIHMLCLNLIRKTSLPGLGLFPMFLATATVAYAVALLLYYLYERPFLRLKDRFKTV